MHEQLGSANSHSKNQSSNPAEAIKPRSIVEEAIAQFLSPFIPEADRLDHWVKRFTLKAMQLGDIVVRSSDDRSFYLVCSGRVRLVSVDQQQQRPISGQVLETGDWLGGTLGDDRWLAYEAIAAESGSIAVLDEHHWLKLMDQIPLLSQHMQIQWQSRHRRLHLKTQTDLGRRPIALSSEQIDGLIPLIEETNILSGNNIINSPEIQQSFGWLSDGEIEGAEAPPIGELWLGSNLSETWRAKTDVTVNYVPESRWAEAVAIAPTLAPLLSIPISETPTSKRKQRKPLTSLVPPNPAPQALAVAVTSPTSSTNNIIDFPRPSRRRFRLLALRPQPFIAQQSSSDCGIACLSMISQYWGKRYSIYVLREMAQVGRSGTTLKNLGATAEQLGFHTRPVRASLNRMAEQKSPWIAHWQGEHYIVVYQVKAQKILIADPATGKRWITKSAFLEGWTNFALLLEPGQQLRAIEDKPGQSLGTFWTILLTYKGLLAQIILLSFLLQLFGLVTPLFTQVILDQVVTQKSLPALHVFSIGLLLFSVWQVGISGVRQYLLDYFSNRLDLTMVSGFVSHCLRLPLKFFEDRNVGDILTRIQENAKIQNFLMRQAISTWLDASMAIVYLGLMLYYNWKLTVFVLATLPPIIILTLLATPTFKKISREIFQASSEQNSQVVEMFTGITTVKSTASEQEIRWVWEDKLVNLLNVQFKGQKLANGLGVVGGLINAVSSAALLWFGASLVIQDQLTIGQFVAFNMLIGNVTGPIMAVVGLWDEFQEVLIAVERLNDVFATKPEETPGDPMMTLPRIQGEVYLDNVTFSYGGDQEAATLQNISFKVNPGETIAIVGRSGSGKSTLIKLLQGLYQPSKGRLLIDGHDLRHVSPQSLRSQQGVVPQDNFLFSGTILDNIRLQNSEVTLENVVEAAKVAEAHGFIQDLPLGYNTKVGERGANLSGGQRQRIAIARALLGDPAILILDEATSSLDTESERRFQQNLERISRNRTTFIIAHRLSTVQKADRILVLDRGILVEQGDHAALMQAQGLYFHLAQQQINI
ncbi:MAG: peptide cleavage/export ABC transporter [Alkalinema sp. RU_4_3]|nr:peptide cleavage/export ABC transporter [Alkalinema sp. RU_4_3]